MVAPAAIPVVPVAQSADDVAADQGFQCTAVLRLYLLLQPEQRSCHSRRCGACMPATEVKPLAVAARYCCRPGRASMFFCDGRLVVSPVTRRSMPVRHTVADGHATGALKGARDMFLLSPAHGCHAQGSCGPSLHSAALLGSHSVGEGKPVGKLQLASAAVCSTHAMSVTSEYLLRAASMLVHAFHHLDNSIPCITG